MKQIFNISTLVIVLSIPFALSSQTRKAIPAGRYEALSGVKNSRSVKATPIQDDGHLKTESANIVWAEALKHLPSETQYSTYFSATRLDPVWSDLLASKGFSASQSMSSNTQLVFSDDLKRDKDLIKNLKSGKIVILKDKQTLKDLVASPQKFEILAYQATDNSQNLYLLKIK